MGITEKLGKMGVPGFRSGKKWKMIIASIGYFFILTIILGIMSSLYSSQSSNPVQEPTQKISTRVPTITNDIQSIQNKKNVDTEKVININQENIDVLIADIEADEDVYDADIQIDERTRVASVAVVINTGAEKEVDRIYRLTKAYLYPELKKSGARSLLIGIYGFKGEKLKLKSEYY